MLFIWILEIFICILLHSVYLASSINLYDVSFDDADANRDIYEIIHSRGFLSEQHFITTFDGYILQLARIVNPYRHENFSRSLKPILLFHGFQCSGSFWIITSKGILMKDGHYYELDENDRVLNGSNQVANTLGFVLASKGYDVWLANYRGSIYSTNHTKYNTESPDYWSFSIDEMASIDLPLMIDYIREKTKHSTISYIGHSQGNFIMLALLSTKTWYSRVIKPFIALSPVFYLDQLVTPLRFYTYLKEVLRSYPTMVPFRKELQQTYIDICKNVKAIPYCYSLYHYFLGGVEQNLNMKRFNVYIANVFMGSSSWNAAHLFQILQHGYPTHFDYGPEENWKQYKSYTPPIYDASNINSTDIALIYLKNDYFNHLINIYRLKNKLKMKLIEDYLIPDETWGHMDLVWSKNAGKYINTKILDILARY